MEGIGFGFWVKLFGVLAVGAMALFVLMLLFVSAIYAWGVLATFIFMGGVAILAGRLYNRREARRKRSYQ